MSVESPFQEELAPGFGECSRWIASILLECRHEDGVPEPGFGM
jgi:hypothetical protein